MVWGAKTQRITTTSTAAAEYIGANGCALIVLWIAHLIRELDLDGGNVPRAAHEKEPIVPLICVDNAACLVSLLDPLHFTKSQRSLSLHYHSARDLTQTGQIKVMKVDGKINLADIFTKALGNQVFQRLRKSIMDYSQ